MKRCTQCGREYDDSKNFCTACGGRLAPVPAAPPPDPGTGGGPGARKDSGSSFGQWGGMVMCIVGLNLELLLNVVLGITVVAGGFLYSIYKANKENIAGAVISGVIFLIGLVLFIWNL